MLDDNALAAIRLRASSASSFKGSICWHEPIALNNVALPLFYAGVRPRARARAPSRQLDDVGLGDRATTSPASSRAASSSASRSRGRSINDPAVLLADEPTGNLDSKTSDDIMALFARLHDGGRTIVMVTHDENVAKNAERVVQLLDGLVVSDTPPGTRPATHL